MRISTVPTVAQRQGQLRFQSWRFTLLAGERIDQYDRDCQSGQRHRHEYNTIQVRVGQIFRPSDQAYAGNQIPEYFDRCPSLLQRYALPTATGAANNFTRIGNEPDAQDQFDFRLDHKFTSNDQVFGRFSFAKDITSPVTPLPEGSGNITAGVTGPTDTTVVSIAGNYVHVFGPRLLNELRVGYTRRKVERQATSLDSAPSQSLNIPGIPTNGAFETTLPTFAIAGLQQLGPSANTASNFRTDVTQVFDALAHQRGKHSLKFGLDFRWERLDVIQPPSPPGILRSALCSPTRRRCQPSALHSQVSRQCVGQFSAGPGANIFHRYSAKVQRPRAHIQVFCSGRFQGQSATLD